MAYEYTRDTGEQVRITWERRGRGHRMRVSIDGDMPQEYHTRDNPQDWAVAWRGEDERWAARLAGRETGGVMARKPGLWWLLFAQGDELLGAAIVEGDDLNDATRNAWSHSCNPGGEILGVPIDPDGEDARRFPRNTLIPKADLEAAGYLREVEGGAAPREEAR